MSLILSAVFLAFTMFQSSVKTIVETTRRCLFHFERIDGVVTPGCIDRSAFLGRWLRSGQTLGAQAYQQIRTFAKHSATQRIARLMLDGSQGNPLAASAEGVRVVVFLTREEIRQTSQLWKPRRRDAALTPYRSRVRTGSVIAPGAWALCVV